MKNKTVISGIRTVGMLLALALPAAAGCGGNSAPDLASQIDTALKTLDRIKMTTENHPWEVMHGIYLFGPGYEIMDAKQNKLVNALQVVCCMPTSKEFIRVDESGPLFADVVGTHEADTHRNMFLSILSAVDTPLYHQFYAFDDNVYPLWRFLDKAMLEIDMQKISASEEVVTGNYGNELGWTLSTFSKYLPLDHKWKNRNGDWATTEEILAEAVSRPPGWGTCFGTHELYGIAAAVNRREAGGEPLSGAWADARKYLDSAIELVKKNQNPDGSISTAWFQERKTEKKIRYSIYATGHTLEWLTLALSPEELRQPWVQKMAGKLAADITKNFDAIKKHHSISTHAGHALKAYKEKALQYRAAR